MNPVSRVLNFLVSPLVPIIGALFSSEVEKLVVLAEIDQQEEIEERARRLEAEGKADLAARLRRRAAKISSECPGQYGIQIMGHLENDCKQLAGPQSDVPDAAAEAMEDADKPGNEKRDGCSTRRGRRRTERTAPAE